ncbi:MAG: Gfo/Idh/MocA family oxidoreductase [Chloroflexota bacterium]|nr:MAG: Gfo/Idh/MocA family oxidoreductase [Chloroflexota bacterium]
MRRVRVGLIGCGGIAQIMHLPYLKELEERFEIAALCDISPTLVRTVASDYGVCRTFTDYREMLEKADLDTVLVLTQHHAEPAIAAARAGKNVLVEKPMVVNLDEADELIDAVRSSGVVGMVGYMKRYDPGYLAGLREIEPVRDRVKLIELHDVIGPNAQFLAHQRVRRFDDAPADAVAAGQRKLDVAIQRAIGDMPDHIKRAYRLLLGLATHDIAILRGAFGSPEKVLSVEIWNDGRYITATIRYPGDARCLFYTGVVGIRRFDEKLTAYADDRIVEITFPSPFLKSTPTMVRVSENRDGAYDERNILASYEEAFKEELIHFHDCIVEGHQPRTPVVEGRKDTELLIDFVRTYVETQTGNVTAAV